MAQDAGVWRLHSPAARPGDPLSDLGWAGAGKTRLALRCTPTISVFWLRASISEWRFFRLVTAAGEPAESKFDDHHPIVPRNTGRPSTRTSLVCLGGAALIPFGDGTSPLSPGSSWSRREPGQARSRPRGPRSHLERIVALSTAPAAEGGAHQEWYGVGVPRSVGQRCVSGPVQRLQERVCRLHEVGHRDGPAAGGAVKLELPPGLGDADSRRVHPKSRHGRRLNANAEPDSDAPWLRVPAHSRKILPPYD